MKKKWWIPLLIFVIIPAGLFSLRWLPDPPIVVSQETTFITEPLTDEGLPDYFEYVRSRMREGVTPENNAVIPLVQALGPDSISPDIRSAWFAELGIEPLPEEGEYLVHLFDDPFYNAGVERMKRVLQSRFEGDQELDHHSDKDMSDVPDNVQQALDSLELEGVIPPREAADYSMQDEALTAFNKLVDLAEHRPWTSELCPVLTSWVRRNQRPFDLVVDASEKEKYYGPFVRHGLPALTQVQLPMTAHMVTLGQSLSRRAMWHLGERRFADAQRDIIAIHRVARLIGATPNTVVDVLVGNALDRIACRAHVALASDPNVPRHVLSQSLSELRQFTRWPYPTDTIDIYERCAALDLVLETQRDIGVIDRLTNQGESTWGPFGRGSVDWNEVLRRMNSSYDEMVAITQMTDPDSRHAAEENFSNKLRGLDHGWLRAKVWVSHSARTDLYTNIFTGMMMPAVDSLVETQDRANGRLDLTLTALALALYRAEHGSYPESLKALTPAQLDAIPEDTFAGGPLKYERRGQGYLLYAVGKHGIDYGGSNEDGTIVDGEWVDDFNEDETGFSNQQGGDLVIRVPMPSWDSMPQSPTPEKPADTTP